MKPGTVFTSSGTVTLDATSTFSALNTVTLGRAAGPDIDVDANADFGDRELKFSTPAAHNISGLEKVESPGALVFGGPASAGPTTTDFVYDVAGSATGTSEVRAGVVVAKEGTNYSGGAANGGKMIVEGVDGRYEYESGGGGATTVKRHQPISTEALLNNTCQIAHSQRWTGSGAPTNPANAYANAYRVATLTEPATISCTPNAGATTGPSCST
jgi:hypothetical protein